VVGFALAEHRLNGFLDLTVDGETPFMERDDNFLIGCSPVCVLDNRYDDRNENGS
jgi:hypothetical protein